MCKSHICAHKPRKHWVSASASACRTSMPNEGDIVSITAEEVAETLNMVTEQHLDIRTITMGISLMSCADENLDRMCTKVYDRITTKAEHLVETAENLERE